MGLLRGHSNLAPRPARTASGLAPFRLRRALDLMQARLAEDLGLAELAAVADLSRRHFTRAFKAETGLSPHRHMLERRVEKAKDLLASTTLPVGEVALACGFSSTSHLALWFGCIAGMSSMRYRAHRGGG